MATIEVSHKTTPTTNKNNSVFPSHSQYSNQFERGPLPNVTSQKDSNMCAGRLWIFLLLGVILVVLGIVSLGIYMNMESVTSSKENMELMPLYIPSGSVLLAGLCVSGLFWKRYRGLVLATVGINVASAFLCLLVGVITLTHMLQPLRTLTMCRFYKSQQLCQCFSAYSRDVFSLKFDDEDLTKYDFEGAANCEDVQTFLPQLLYTVSIIYCLVFVVAIGAAVLALLILRAESVKRGFLSADSYEEVYTVSGSSQDQSDSESDDIPDVVTSGQCQTPVTINSQTVLPKNSTSQTPLPKNSTSNSLNQNSTRESTPISHSSINKVNTVGRRAVTPQLTNQEPVSRTQVQRSKTPGLNDLELGKESLANRYKINKTPDREINVRQRLSKTPDREIGSHRRNSFTVSKRLSKSCDSLDSSGNEARERAKSFGTDGKKKGKLKDHRRKGKRAATVHTLDTDQLLLILNLQMRYLQESKEQKTTTDIYGGGSGVQGNRRAVTPQPVSQKQIIPQKIRSHTPQPRRANGRFRDQRAYDSYAQNLPHNNGGLNQAYRQPLRSDGKSYVSDSAASSRRTSQSSEKSNDLLVSNGNNDFVYYQGNRGNKTFGADSYLHSQQIRQSIQTAPNIKNGYNPYIHSAQITQSVDSVNYVTYSDSMLNNPSNAPISRSGPAINLKSGPMSRQSVQNYFLPSQPVQRGKHQNLPPTPISRQKVTDRQLPPQPVHRGQSAFHIVDRKSKSRSSSVSSDLSGQLNMEIPKRLRSKNNSPHDPIRDNFSMQPQMRDGGRDSRREGENENSNFILRDPQGSSGQDEPLPPYSGPPSYKEYVSSCNTSVNSSLSSNPDDIYSFPKRRGQRLNGNTSGYHGNGKNDKFGGNTSGMDDNNVSGKMFKFTGAATTDMNHINRGHSNGMENYQGEGQIQGSEENSGKKYKWTNQNSGNNVVQGQRSCAEGQESINSKVKVKQIIVPEDYYSSVIKEQKNDSTYANNDRNKMPDQSINDQGKIREPDYGNTNAPKLAGYQYNFDDIDGGQIGPDEHYHEYEDVYDTPANVKKSGKAKDGNRYSVKNHGLPNSHMPKSVKSNVMSPKVERKFDINDKMVENVHSSEIKHGRYGIDSEFAKASSKVGASVENVHADVVKKIPRIRLNDLSVENENVDDDDVFVEESAMGNGKVGDVEAQMGGVATRRIQNYEEIDELDSANQNQASGHVTCDSSNQQTDEGYMKMTLPSKVFKLNDNTENYGIAVHLTGISANQSSGYSYGAEQISTNQNALSGHVDSLSANESSRHMPDGEDNSSDLTNQSYEETGV
ncbi:uncharacterized protein LOC128222241 [Mya arenaria]|uniref:uncharacterized protein LOC128222241 n=1 Tax=Mya arenaria TaxID=6604 RepID=UPI0022E81ADC|nr:uncharacterized protein LOC128222241 [Mya arenaria]